jgi:hypothetical protein
VDKNIQVIDKRRSADGWRKRRDHLWGGLEERIEN